MQEQRLWEVTSAARNLMEKARYCSLITRSRGHGLRARLMDPFPPGSELTVWLGTHRKSRKVREIENDPDVLLTYHDHQGLGYVALNGVAELRSSPSERRAHWKSDWRPFYPEGPEAADFLALAVVPQRIEVVSYDQGVASDPLAWRPAVLWREDEQWFLDEPPPRR